MQKVCVYKVVGVENVKGEDHFMVEYECMDQKGKVSKFKAPSNLNINQLSMEAIKACDFDIEKACSVDLLVGAIT